MSVMMEKHYVCRICDDVEFVHKYLMREHLFKQHFDDLVQIKINHIIYKRGEFVRQD